MQKHKNHPSISIIKKGYQLSIKMFSFEPTIADDISEQMKY